jgi:phospholipase/carboxylesterase
MNTTLRDVRSQGWTADAVPDAVALLLHGFGSNEHDLGSLGPVLGLGLPWASLRAPVELGNGGAAWFSITTPGSPAAGAVENATDAIWDWVEANVDHGTRIVPIGLHGINTPMLDDVRDFLATEVGSQAVARA